MSRLLHQKSSLVPSKKYVQLSSNKKLVRAPPLKFFPSAATKPRVLPPSVKNSESVQPQHLPLRQKFRVNIVLLRQKFRVDIVLPQTADPTFLCSQQKHFAARFFPFFPAQNFPARVIFFCAPNTASSNSARARKTPRTTGAP